MSVKQWTWNKPLTALALIWGFGLWPSSDVELYLFTDKKVKNIKKPYNRRLYCLYVYSPDEWATTKQACRDELVVYLFFSPIYTSLYFYVLRALFYEHQVSHFHTCVHPTFPYPFHMWTVQNWPKICHIIPTFLSGKGNCYLLFKVIALFWKNSDLFLTSIRIGCQEHISKN